MSATVTAGKQGMVATQGVNRRILQAATSVAAATVVVKIAATLKEVTVAGAFGRSDAMDAFLAAFLIPNLLINLFAESMNQALVPTLIRVRISRATSARKSCCRVRCCGCAGCWLLPQRPWLCSPGSSFRCSRRAFRSGKLDLAVRLFYALLPVVLLSGVASNCIAVLNTCERFALPALTPAVMPLSIMAGALAAATCAWHLGACVRHALRGRWFMPGWRAG